MKLAFFVLCHLGLSWCRPDKIPSKSWMSYLNDNTRLNRMSIPGTHDSGARGAAGLRTGSGSLANTQTFTIKEQLQHGVRFFDIRLKINGDRMGIYHGPVWYGWLDDVLKDFGNFLTANSEEVVFMMYKHEGGNGGNSFKTTFVTNFQNHYVIRYGRHRYHECNDHNAEDHCPIPKLGDVRGKIILINKEKHGTLGTRYFRSEDTWNMREDDTQYERFGCREICEEVVYQESFAINDNEGWRTRTDCRETCRYDTYMNRLKTHMTSAKTKESYSLTFCSVNTAFSGLFYNIQMIDGPLIIGQAPRSPEGWARQVNKRMMSILRQFPNNQNAALGFVLFDFPSTHLIRSVFMKNHGKNDIFKTCARIGFDGWKITWDLADGYSKSFGGYDHLNDYLAYVLLENGCKLKVWQDVGYRGASEVFQLHDYSEDGSADRNSDYEGWLKNGWENDVSSLKCWC